MPYEFLNYKIIQMNLQKLKILSDELSKIDSKYYAINAGGCGFFAALLTKEFSKLNCEVTGYFLIDDFRPKLSEFNNYINNNEKIRLKTIHSFGTYCAHILVKFVYRKKVYYIDSTGVYKNEIPLSWSRFNKAVELSPKQTIELGSNKTDEWNDRFDRSQIPAIKKDVKEVFKRIAA